MSWRKLGDILANSPVIEGTSLTPFALAIPEELKQNDAVKAYRAYYKQKEKEIEMRWTKRNKPQFME